MRVAIASPPIPKGIGDGLQQLELLVEQAAGKQAGIICFPESYLPGYPGMPYPVADRSKENLERALARVQEIAAANNIAIIIPMDWHSDAGLLNVAHVVAASGEHLGYQAKVQLDPTEDATWVPGTQRRVFETGGLKFGISICHEGFRYPETVRWAARQGAQIVFHPHFSGSDTGGTELKEWGHKDNPYYEKAMMMRALENTIYFASSNYASRYAESASALIAPDGSCLVHETYGRPGIIVADIIPEKASALLAKRLKALTGSN